MKKSFIFAVAALFLLVGCSTKRQYFEPNQGSNPPSLSYSGSLSSSIESSSIGGATLRNGSVIGTDGPQSGFGFDNGFSLLSFADDGLAIASDLKGELVIKNSGAITTYKRKFPEAIVAASFDSGLLAAVSADNNLYLIDTQKDKVLMQYASKEVYAIDSRSANPYFLGSLIIYPSLDGKIYILNKATSELIRDVTISSEEFFNNVIYLGVVGDTMIAATAKRVISVSPKQTIYYDGEIKDVLTNGDDVYIFKKDGSVLKTDLNFAIKGQTYFKFAIFTGATINDDALYIVEKTGYLFKTDLNLQNQEIYRLPAEIDDRSFISPKALYVGSSYLNLN